MKTDRHVIVAAADRELIAAVGAAVGRLPNISLEVGPPTGAARLAGGKGARAAALVVEVDPRTPGRIEEFRRLAHALPAGRIVAAVRDAAGEDVRRLFRAGAADVLTSPFTGEAVRAGLSELLKGSPKMGEPGGQVISVIKGCGGAGATTVALNLAALMAAGEAKRGAAPRSTAVLDLDLQYGDSDVALDLAPRSTIVEVLKDAERVDARFLLSVMTEHSSGLKLLAPPASIVPMEALTAGFATELINHTTEAFDRTILDLPTTWTDWTLAALNRSDLIVLVTTATVAGALGARRVLDALQEAGLRRSVLLVVNKLAGQLEAWERPSRIARSLEVEVDAGLMLDRAAQKSADLGRLVVEAAPTSRLAKDLRAMAAKVDGRLDAIAVSSALAEIAA